MLLFSSKQNYYSNIYCFVAGSKLFRRSNYDENLIQISTFRDKNQSIFIYISVKFQCITMYPFSKKLKSNKIPKAIQIEYIQAKKYIDSLIGLCVQHQTKDFVYQYCHGGQARQFDNFITRAAKAKSEFQNIILGKVVNSTQNIEIQKEMNKIQKGKSSQDNKKQVNNINNSIYISPQPQFIKINFSQFQQYKFIPQIGLIKSNNEIQYNQRFISIYKIICNQNKLLNHYFQIEGVAISNHQIVLTNKIVNSFIPNITKQNLNKNNCTCLTQVKFERKINFTEWQKINKNLQKQIHDNFTQDKLSKTDKKIKNQKNNNQNKENEESKSKQKSNLQNLDSISNQAFDQLMKLLKQQLGVENKIIEEKLSALQFSPKLRTLQDYIYGQISHLCLPRHILFQTDQPFQSSSFFLLPNSTLSLKIDKNIPPNQQKPGKVYHQLFVWVEQIISKNVLRIKPIISQNQLSKDEIQNAINLLYSGVQIKQCEVLSTQKLKPQKIKAMSAGWSNQIYIQNQIVKVGDTLRCKQPISEFMFNLTIGNNFLINTSIFQSYSWIGQLLEQYQNSVFDCYIFLEQTSSQLNKEYQKRALIEPNQINQILINNQAFTHQLYVMSPKCNSQRQFNLSQFEYKIQFQSSSMISIEIKDENGNIIDKYLISDKKIYYLKKNCNFSQIKRDQCQQIEIIYENSYFQNKTVDNKNYFSTVYLKIVKILQKGQQIYKAGIWRKGDYQPFARMFFNHQIGTITIIEGLVYVRQISLNRKSKPASGNNKNKHYNQLSPVQTSYTLIQGQFCSGNINKHRSTVIKFKCGQPILSLEKVKETQPCIYQFNVISNKLCGQSYPLNRKSGLQIKKQTICYEDGMVMMYF